MELAAAADEATAGGLMARGGAGRVLVEVRNLRKEYATGRGRLVLFEGINFQVKRQQMLAIVGQSGAGKSTLLHILGALDTASAGEVYFESTLLRSLSPGEAADFRNREIGYVWQFHYFCPNSQPLRTSRSPFWREVSQKKRQCRKPHTGSAKWDWRTGPPIAQVSFLAGSSSGSRLRAR